MAFDLTENRRLEEIRSDYNESQTEFAKRLKLKQGYLSEVERGSKTVKGVTKHVGVSSHIKLILYYELGVSQDWFEKGIAPKYKNGTNHPTMPARQSSQDPSKSSGWMAEKLAILEEKNRIQDLMISKMIENSKLKEEVSEWKSLYEELKQTLKGKKAK